jgi:hypothetical protein
MCRVFVRDSEKKRRRLGIRNDFPGASIWIQGRLSFSWSAAWLQSSDGVESGPIDGRISSSPRSRQPDTVGLLCDLRIKIQTLVAWTLKGGVKQKTQILNES